jgi:hypothetical protein
MPGMKQATAANRRGAICPDGDKYVTNKKVASDSYRPVLWYHKLIHLWGVYDMHIVVPFGADLMLGPVPRGFINTLYSLSARAPPAKHC